MNVLVICHFGKNRSAYLARYLKTKGYNSDFAGVDEVGNNLVTVEKIDWSDVVVFVHPNVEKDFFQIFKTDKRIITLNVEDRTEFLPYTKPIVSAADWVEMQKTLVYPELEKQINKYLPL